MSDEKNGFISSSDTFLSDNKNISFDGRTLSPNLLLFSEFEIINLDAGLHDIQSGLHYSVLLGLHNINTR